MTKEERAYKEANDNFPLEQNGNIVKNDIAFHSYLKGATDQDPISRAEQQKIDIEKACAEVDAILEEYGIKSYDRSRNLKRIKQAMEE